MAELHWLETTDPWDLLNSLSETASERKLRFFAARTCRHFFCNPHGGDDYADEEVLTPIEQFADGLVGEVERFSAREIAATFDTYTYYAMYKSDALMAISNSPFDIWPVWEALVNFTTSQSCDPGELEQVARQHLIELFAGDFLSLSVDPNWLTSTVTGIAETIYQDRTFGNLPVLADALQDAGCDNEDILNHCRQPGEHVRGCWVVDLVTGRK